MTPARSTAEEIGLLLYGGQRRREGGEKGGERMGEERRKERKRVRSHVVPGLPGDTWFKKWANKDASRTKLDAPKGRLMVVYRQIEPRVFDGVQQAFESISKHDNGDSLAARAPSPDILDVGCEAQTARTALIKAETTALASALRSSAWSHDEPSMAQGKGTRTEPDDE